MVTPRKNNSDEDGLDKKVQSLYDSTSRVDERVKILLESMEKLDTKLEKIIDKQLELQTKIILFEEKLNQISDNVDDFADRIEDLEKGHNDLYTYKMGAESQVKNVFTMIYNAGVTVYNIALPIVIGYILYAIGLPK